MVHTMQPPRALIGGQPTKVQSKMTLRPKAATPVNRSRSLIQVWPLSQFSDLEQGWSGSQGKDHSKQTLEQSQPLSKGPWALRR